MEETLLGRGQESGVICICKNLAFLLDKNEFYAKLLMRR